MRPLPSPLRCQSWLKRVTRMAQAHQIAIAEAMMRADFYPHPAPSTKRHETRISTVFLTGSFVYKMKKAVDVGFLDFSTLTQRRHYCRQEVALNRRLSHGIYLAAVPITRHGGCYWLQGPGPAVEFAVRMRQLRESDAMYRCLQRAALTEAQLDVLVRLLVDFYTRAATIREADAEAVPAWEENLQQVGTCAASRSSTALNSANSCALWTSSATWHFWPWIWSTVASWKQRTRSSSAMSTAAAISAPCPCSIFIAATGPWCAAKRTVADFGKVAWPRPTWMPAGPRPIIRLDTDLRPSVCLRQLLPAEVFSAGVSRRIGRGPPATTTAAREAP